MNPEVTMTIEVSVLDSPDLFTDNRSLLFHRPKTVQDSTAVPQLGAVTFISEKSDASLKLTDLAAACGKKAFSLIRAYCGEPYKGWLFVADGPWREATRVVLHQRLWKNHRNLIEATPSGTRSDEIEIKCGTKVRYAGLLDITDGLIDMATNAARTCPSFAIIFSRRNDITLASSIGQIFCHSFPKEDGLKRTSVDWMSLAIALCPEGDLLLRVTGLFDDHEAAVDVIGTPKDLLALRCH